MISTVDMPILYHHALSPHSRFARLAASEYGMKLNLCAEKPWQRRHDFLHINPAGTLPVLVDENGVVVCEAVPIAEYLDETCGEKLAKRRLLPLDAGMRAEIRRLMAWFHSKFYMEVSHYLVTEKIYKREMPSSLGGGAPDASAIRAGRNNIRYHLRYVGHLIRERNWLAGERLSFADLAAAAHFSVMDFLHEVPWEEDEIAKDWYARIKSRPSFRPLLHERILGFTPPDHYADLDF